MALRRKNYIYLKHAASQRGDAIIEQFVACGKTALD